MLMLVDAAGLYFRAFYGLPESLTAPDGRPVNAIRGYLDMSATLIERRKPTRYIACLDLDWRPPFRVKLVPSYKTHRVAADGVSEEIPEALAPQVPLLLEVLAALGLATAGCAGFEADDVIATLATAEEAAGENIEVVTGDRDLMALATDKVTILYTAQGLAKLGVLGAAEVLEKYGVPAAHYPDFAALRGDPSDGLPGVAGVGEKTAAMLVNSFGPVESIVAAAEAGAEGLPAAVARKILASRAYLAVAPEVVRGRRDVPLPIPSGSGWGTLPTEPADARRLAELVDELGIGASVERMQKAIRAAAEA